MSEADPGPLPTAAVDITDYRRAVDRAGDRVRTGPTRFGWIVVVLILAIVVVVAVVAPDNRFALAGAAIAVVITLSVLIRSGIVAARREREALDEVAAALDRAVSRVTTHLASIGYAVPPEIALDWVSTPASSATVLLVHDSVIAARWWHPAPGDDRVFVEPFLRQEGRESSLPPLAPLTP